jgi:hypothetical protein
MPIGRPNEQQSFGLMGEGWPEPVGLDYSIAPGQACGLRSSLSDLLGGLPDRTQSARLSQGAGSA